ncbi:MAG: tetratricopeptide repeat protein [Trichodesmium sp. MAG_R02]|nr:tetratricopeptide repeat protein [Trichodesmium sp. MAG_R02]
MHGTSLQGFDYGDVIHQFEKRCTLLRQGKLEETIASYQNAIELNPQFAWFY